VLEPKEEDAMFPSDMPHPKINIHNPKNNDVLSKLFKIEINATDNAHQKRSVLNLDYGKGQ